MDKMTDGHPGPDGLRAADEYEHEDAFKEANRCAGRLTRLAARLSNAVTDLEKRRVLEECRVEYQNLFSAFIAGVDFGRKNPK